MSGGFSERELGLIRFALRTAIASEEEFIEGHRNVHSGEFMSNVAEIVGKTKVNITRMKRLLKKLGVKS